MNIKMLLTIVGVLAILVAALAGSAAFAQGPSGQNPPLGLGRGNWGWLVRADQRAIAR